MVLWNDNDSNKKKTTRDKKNLNEMGKSRENETAEKLKCVNRVKNSHRMEKEKEKMVTYLHLQHFYLRNVNVFVVKIASWINKMNDVSVACCCCDEWLIVVVVVVATGKCEAQFSVTGVCTMHVFACVWIYILSFSLSLRCVII